MTNISETQSMNLCFVGLPLVDQATFERVISFSKARGQHIEITLNPSDAHVLITDDDANNLQTAQQLQSNNLLLVVSNDKACSEGDVQLQRPLLVTRVMRTMESLTSKLAEPNETKENTSTVPPTSDDNPMTSDTETKAATKTATEKTPEITPTPAVKAPKEEVSQLTEAKQPAEDTTTEAAPTSDYLALVIDDSSAIRKQLEIELRTAGLRCEFAESGEEALEKIKDAYYDIVFLDIMMPGIDGYETCGKLRKDPRYKKTPVVMLSGKTAPLDEVRGVIAGASTYLTKPVQHAQFQRITGRITRWLDEFR